jgi:hypothetical protein
MNQRTSFMSVLGFAVVLWASPLLQANNLENNQTLKLSNGRVVKVLSVSKVEYSKGIMALMVRYQTSLSVDERKALGEEVDALWKVAVKDVEHYGFNEAIISSNEIPKGIFVTANRMLNFIYEKGADGKWHRLTRADFMAAE